MKASERMDITSLFRRDLRELEPYKAVDSPEALAEMAGIPPERIIKLNGNENPYGPSRRVQEALGRHQGYHIYPDASQKASRSALEEYTGVSQDNLIVGAGADELIDLLLRATLDAGDGVIDCPPTFGMYTFSAQVNGGRLVSIPRDDQYNVDLDAVKSAIEPDTKVVFLASPNNPTGNLVSEEVVLGLLEEDVLVVIDETYYEFSGHTVGAPGVRLSQPRGSAQPEQVGRSGRPAAGLRHNEPPPSAASHGHQAALQHQRGGRGGVAGVPGRPAVPEGAT